VRIRRLRGARTVVLTVAVGLAACQSQSSINRNPHSGAVTATMQNGIQTVVVTTGDNYRFNPSTITVHPGKVRITLEHKGNGAPHDWQLQGFPAASVPLINPGQSKSIDFVAPAPGSYTFICSIHLKQGQTGTLVVLPN
jgi:plastocyanin